MALLLATYLERDVEPVVAGDWRRLENCLLRTEDICGAIRERDAAVLAADLNRRHSLGLNGRWQHE